MSSAIEFENVSKQYRLGLVSSGTISHDLNRWWTMRVLHKEDPYLKIGETNDRSKKGLSEYVWALKDINFNVEQGDVVGIIGKNGAGKSTLLKLLSRVTAPSTGEIRVRGRIASLLEVGTGFHPEMTGRENIFMNGAIMGMTKQEVGRKLDEIIDFSGCERYIDTPVKRYSSGMTVRLGFAIAAHLEPEILVVDEVLAVGDFDFQKKAIGKMQEVSQGGGRTVLFVSHNMASIRKLCKTGVLLDNGMVSYSGGIEEVVSKYMSTSIINKLVSHAKFEENGKKHQIQEVQLLFSDGKEINRSVDVNEDVYIKVKYRFNEDCRQHLCFTIYNQLENVVLFNERSDYYNDFATVEKGTYESLIKIPNPLLKPGRYTISFSALDRLTKYNDARAHVLSFEISNKKVFRQIDRLGELYIPVQWELTKL